MVSKAASVESDVGSGRRRLSPEDRQLHLVRACLDLIGRRPWDEVSMAEVAQAAGVSKPLLYHYFSTKTDLYRAAVRTAAGELRAATASSDDIPGPLRLRRSLEAHLDWIDANANAYRAILQGAVSADDEVQSIIDESRTDVVARLAAGFGFEEPTPEQRTVLRGWVGFLEGATLDWLMTKDVDRAGLTDLLAASVTSLVRLLRDPDQQPR